jgi:ATP-binding cassette subfamily B protein
MSNIFPTYFNALASAERILEIENIADEAEVNADADISHIYDDMDSICFEDISFAFDRDSVLEDTSLEVKKGEFIAVSGISGIGKSTLMKLLLSVYQPLKGRIYIRTSKDEYKVDKSMRKLFSYVPQGNFLLSGTLRENIAFVAPDATEEDIMDAARVACAYDFISELPQGLDTVISERGGGLSEGQVQRVAIARAIALNPRYLFCDEPNSGLDPKTSLVIDQLIQDITQECNICTIVNSHDMNSIMEIGDNIVFLRNGVKEWQGSRHDIFQADNEALNDFVFASELFKKVKSAYAPSLANAIGATI